MEKRAAALVSSTPGIKSDSLGIGTLSTWHGTPDLRVRGVEVIVRKPLEELDDEDSEMVEERDSDEEGSDGGSAPIEVKITYMSSFLPQTIATCVVSSFTERNLHPRKPSIVPTILLARNQFRVCLYDCVTDALLISEPKPMATKGGLSRSTVAFQWLVINHR